MTPQDGEPNLAPTDTATGTNLMDGGTGSGTDSRSSDIAKAMEENLDINDLQREPGQPARGPDGKFQSAQPKPVEGQQQPPAKAADGTDVVDPNAPPVQPGAVEPPSSWPAADKEAFKALPPEVQGVIVKREKQLLGEFTKRSQELANIRSAYTEFDKIIAPRVNVWARAGMNPAQAVHQLLALSDFANSDPGAFIKEFAQANKVNLEELAFGQSSTEVDPALQQRDQKIDALQREIDAIKSGTQRSQATQQQREIQSTQQSIEAFAQTKDPATGQLKYPFLDEVQAHMAALITGGQANSLEDAYDAAVHANKDTRAKIYARNNNAATADLRNRSEQAKRAGASVSGALPNGAVQTANMDRRDVIAAAIEGRL